MNLKPPTIVEEHNLKNSLELWTIQQIFDYIHSGTTEEKELLCQAKVIGISNRKGWKYLSCATCSKKLGRSATSLMYKAHINVEWCTSSKAIKYLFKYITKGVDKATIVFQISSKEEQCSAQEEAVINEVTNFQECRYLSACEAAWRIFAFDIHYQTPAVQKLTLHLKGEETMVFDENDDPQDVLSKMDMLKTMFTQWMVKNETDPDPRKLFYIQFPLYYVWNKSQRIWTERKQRGTIGRLVNVEQREIYCRSYETEERMRETATDRERDEWSERRNQSTEFI